MKAVSIRRFLLSTSVLALPVLFGSAFAAEDTTDNGGIPEIVVTAQRQAQNVLAVPLSIQAISGEQLEKSGMHDIDSLQFTVPGFIPSDSVGYDQLFIRGIGNSVFGYADPSVTQFIDDVPRIYPTMISSFLDVDRIEVLKGAQGGLYGRNATGGVLNIITRQPNTDAFSGNVVVSYGEKNTFRAAGYVNIPISDKVAWSASVERDSHDAYVKNLQTTNTPLTAAMFPAMSQYGTAAQTAAFFNSAVHSPNNLNNQDLWGFDTKLLVKPVDNLKVTLAADYAQKTDASGNGLVDTTPAYYQPSIQNIYYPFVAGVAINLPPGFITGGNGKFTTTSGVSANSHIFDYGASLTPVLSLPGVDITSISAYRQNRFYGLVDVTPAEIGIVLTNSHFHKSFFYQEVRAVSTGDGPFKWLGGATYLDNVLNTVTPIEIVPPSPSAPPNIVGDVTHNWSVYAQVGYDFLTDFNLTASGRYIHETHATTFFFPTGSPPVHLSEEKFLPSGTLTYKLEDGGGNIYARYARGFKAGGVNTAVPPAAFGGSTLGLVFGPEVVDTYEVGYRNSLFDHKVSLTADIFYNHYTGLQTTAHSSNPLIIFAIVNAPLARTWGAEETLSWRVIPPLTLGVNAGYLNAEYLNYTIPPNPALTTQNLNGTVMANSPKLQLSFTADLDEPLNDKFNLVGNVLETHTSAIEYSPSGDPGNIPNAVGPGYWLTNLRLGVKTSDGKYGFSVYANNVFNQVYYVYGSSSAGFGNILGYGNPRIVGGEINVKF